MEKKSTGDQEQLENGRLIPKLWRTIRKYKSRIIFILILILILLKNYILPDLIEHEFLGVYMIVHDILWVLILLLIILLIISFGKKSTSLEKKNTSFGKKSTADQVELEEKRILRKIFLPIGIFLLSLILFAIGESCGANSTFELILCLPGCVMAIGVPLLFIVVGVTDYVKEKKHARGAKIACVLFLVLAVLVACFVLFVFARDLIASFDPPSMELTQLSAEYHQGEMGSAGNEGDTGTPDEYTLFGVDSDGKEHEFNIDKDEWDRLTEVGKEDYVTSEESDYWIIEFDEDVRLICKYLPSGSLVDFETVE